MASRSRRSGGLFLVGAALLLAVGASGQPVAASGQSVAAGDEARRYRALAASEGAFARGVAAHRRGDLTLAREGYAYAIEQDPSFVEAIVNLARVHIVEGDLRQGAVLLDRAEELRPAYPAIEAVRGLLALERGDAASAVDELSEAHGALPEDLEVLNNLGAGLIAQGRIEEAIKVLDEARRLDPTRPTPVFNLALAYDRAGDVPRAGHFYARYLQLAGQRGAMRASVQDRLAVLQGEGRGVERPEAPPVGAGSISNDDATASVGGM